ncbi:hypothetical protein [Prosthecobacter sp.]|uniref:hypothetical protein n=1 Tax=Prosthecobacter sp. TaxID=1965333 RepID=UPI003BAEFA7D
MRPLAANSSGSASTAVPDTQQSIANFLQERGMPTAEAQAASAAIAQHPAMAGQDYDYFHKEPILRAQLLSDLGITGSQNSKESATNPLRYSAAPESAAKNTKTPPANANPSASPPSIDGSGSQSLRPLAANSPALPPAVQAALDDSIPGTPSQEVFTAIKKAVQAKELTEQQATTLVAQQSGALDHTELRQSLENKLGWNPTRANTAAALHFGDKTQSSIPLAAAQRTQGEGLAKPLPDSGNPVNSGNPVQNSGSDSPPSSLRANSDYATARLAALARIKDPAKKAWTREFLTSFEKSFERHHLLYDAIGTGPVARKLLGGNFTAVMDLGGKITRLIDLDAMASQFDYLQTPAAAVAATGIEEDVHALVLRLARENPSKYGRPALIKQWKSLPPALQQTVWNAYNAASQGAGLAKSLPTPELSTKDQWNLMNEFLRMLVQDARFAGQITETVDAQPSLLQWVKDFLKDLGQTLRSLIAKAPPALAKELDSMVADIGQRLTTIEGRSTSTTARLESLTSLRDPAAAARQTLAALGATTPIFSPAALERIFNQMPAALQKQTFHQWQQSQPAEKPAKASKADLMRFLLGQMLADPSLATSTLLLAEAPATSLLAKVLQKLSTLTQGAGVANSLRTLHVATLRALGGLHGMAFVQRLSPAQQQLYTAALAPVQPQNSTASPPPTAPTGRAADMLAALEALEQDHQQASTPAAALRLREKLRQQEIAQNRALFFAQDNAARTLQEPEASPDRGADMLAALQAHEDALALDHQQASTPAAAALLRTKLGLQRVARNRSRFFLRDNAARELHAAEQAGRQDLPKAQSLLALALGHIGSRRAASGWRTLGIPERRQLALLGIGVDQHPHTEPGGYPYSLSRIESAELRLEFSIAGTPENQMAQEELTWMRQQPAEYQTALDPLSPAYVERDHVIIKQSALDDLSLAYPHTAALIRPELEARQSYGLRVDARSAQVKQAGVPAPPEERQSNTQQPELPTSSPSPTSGNSANSVNPVQNSGSGSGIPLPKNNSTVSPTPPSLSFPIPLSKRGQVRRSTFPDAESLAAFQFKLDADTASAARSTALEVKKAEQRALNLLARLMEDSPLTRTELEAKLLDYHRTLVQQAESASAFGTFQPPSFHAFARSAPSEALAKDGPLPPPEGGDILAAMRAQGIRRLGPPDSSDGWSWYRSLQQDASTSKLKNAEAQRLARAGDLTDPKARLFWLNENVVSLTSGRSIDEAATELSESEDQSFPVGTGDELGQAILSALDARIQAAQNPASSIEDQESSARESAADFATYAAGTPGQPFTAAELAKELQPEDEIQIGSEYLTVLEADPSSGSITLDSSRFGPVTLTGPQILHLTSGPNHLRIPQGAGLAKSHLDSGNPASSIQSQAAQEALRNAHSPSYKPDLLKPSPIESTLRDGPLPTVTPQDTAGLDRDYHAAVTAGEALDQSTPDLDLEDDIADSADAYLDGELLPAAARSAPSEALAKDGPASKFYSALARAIESKMPARSTPATVVGILKNAGIKTEELKWTGIIPWLHQQAQNGPITQQQVLDYLANEGAVHLQEVRLGGSQTQLEDANRAVITQAKAEGMTQSGAENYALTAARGQLSPGQQSLISPGMRPLVARLRASYEARATEYAAGQSQPKYSQYQLPNGTNYREVVLSTSPKKKPSFRVAEAGPKSLGRYFDTQGQAEAFAQKMRENGASPVITPMMVDDTRTEYHSSHFPDVPNYVAHMRLNDRTDAAGHPGTFIEEIQSDRHQAGREKGYQGENEARMEQSTDPLNPNAWRVIGENGQPMTRYMDRISAQGALDEVLSKDRVPDAPFRTTWPLQMFKRALADAVASGKQWIGWTTGDTQADRYKLSNQVDSIAVWQNGGRYGFEAFKDKKVVTNKNGLTDSELADFIGKDLASKAVKDLEAKRKVHIYSGEDLNVGGHGMRGFYDQILSKEISKYVKQWGAGVQRAPLSAGPSSAFTEAVKRSDAAIAQYGHGSPQATEAILAIPSDSGQDTTPIWRIDITPQMRAGVEAGQALFAAQRSPLADSLAQASQAVLSFSGSGNPEMSGNPVKTPGAQTPILEAIDRIQDWYSSDTKADALEYLPKDLQEKIEADPRWLWLDSHSPSDDLPSPNWFPQPYHDLAASFATLSAKAATTDGLTDAEEEEKDTALDKLYDWELDDGPRNHIISTYQSEIETRLKSSIEAIEATGRWEWNKKDQTFDSTDEDATTVLYAARRAPHPLALPRPGATLSPDEALRSPSHILASLYADSAPHPGADGSPGKPKRGEPRPSVGGSPGDFARLLDWAKANHRLAAPQLFQLSADPARIIAGGEHLVIPHRDNGRLYKFTKPGFVGAQALDGPAYIERLALSNHLWQDDVKFEGFTRFPGDHDWRAVISQPFYAAANPAKPDAPMADILALLKDRGFIPFEAYHIHPDLGLQLWDIQTPGNVIATAHGPMPVDLQLEPADPSRLKRLREHLQQQPLPAAQRVASSAHSSSTNVNLGAQDSTQRVSLRAALKLETGEAAALESFVNTPVSDAVALRQSLNGRTLLTKLNSLIKRPAQTPKLVDLNMLPLGDDLQIVDGVVQSIPISVVNDLLGGELAANRFLYKQTVFEPLSSDTPNLNAQQTVGRGISGKLTNVSNGAAHTQSLTSRQTEVNQRAEKAANETDPAPSEAQKAAGNYAKGKFNWNGLTISIENPRGSVRRGTDDNGKAWGVTMPHHYGYVLGTTGKDKDHVDIFLGPNLESQLVLIVNQRKPGNGHFDEHKLMAGFDSPIAAARAYLASYTPGWRGFGSAVPTTIPVLKEWLQNHDTTKIATRESIAKIAQTLPLKNPEIPANSVNPVQNLDSGILPAASRLQRTLDKAQALDRRLATLPGASTTAKALDKSVTGIGQAANLIPTAVGKAIQGITGLGVHIPGHEAMSAFGTRLGAADAAAASAAGHAIANALQRVSGKDIRKAPDAVAAWLNKPDGLGSWTKSVVVDQLLPTALMPREWLALSHEMQRKTAFGAEKSNDLVRALSGNPRLSDLAYPTEFAQNPAYREQLFDAMENKIPMDSLPPAMQALAQRLRAMLRETGLELVRQGLMNPDTFEELQSNGWMPRYMLEEAQESAGSLLAAFKLGIQDLRQQRSTAYHIVDTTRRGKDGQYLTVNRQEGGRNAWRFRDAASRDAFYSDFIRQQALEMLQDRHGNTKELQTMLSTLDGQQRREVRSQIQLLTRADMDAPAKLSQALAGMVKQAIELQKAKYKKEAPFDPPKLIKDPVYAIARYILAQTHNAATMELLSETAKNKEWTSNVSLQGFTPIPDQTRFGPLAGKFVQNDIAQQILDKLDVPNAALRFYDAILRKWKSGKLVWNPGSHIRDAVGNAVFAYLGGSSIANPGNWPYYRQAMDIMRHGGPLYAELLEHGVLGGDAYSSLVREKLKGLLPDAKTVENFNPGLLQRFWFDFGSKFNTTHEQLAEYRRMPDDFYKIASYLKAKNEARLSPSTLRGEGRGEGPLSEQEIQQLAAAHVRKWFPYYDRLGASWATRNAGRFVNPFFSFFRESTRILALAAKERPIALSAALAFPAALSALSAMLLGLEDRDKDEIGKDLAGRGKGILGLSNLHLFSMLLPFRSSQGQVQQWDISSIMPFADLLGQKVVPLEEKENAWQTFWRQTAAAGPIGNLGVSWITNRDLFSGRHLTEADMSTPEMLRAYTQHAAGVALPPLAPDLAAAVGIGDGGALTKAGQRQVNKTLQTYDPVQTVIRSVFGMNVKSAAPNIYRQAEDFRKAHGYDAQPGFDYGTTVTSRAKRLLVQELAQDSPNPRRITALATRLKALGVPLETSGDIAKVLKIIDPSQIMNGSKKSGLSAEQARQQFRQSLPPESRTLYEASLSEFERIKQKAPALLHQ